MKLTNMAHSKAQSKKNDMPTKLGSEKYPYGLNLSLDHDSLKKLGLKHLPKVGSHVHIHAKAHVQSTEMRKHSDGNMSRNMQLQIQHLALSARPNSALDAVNSGISDADKDGE